MNKRGFTLVELLATLIILGLIVSLTIVGINTSVNKAKEKTENVFVGSVRDALRMYIDSDAKRLSFDTSSFCTISKTHGNVNVYKATDELTFTAVLDSKYVPLTKNEFLNPANKDTDRYECSDNGTLEIYRDEDYVYYYKISKSSLGCLNDEDGYITNLPDCN